MFKTLIRRTYDSALFMAGLFGILLPTLPALSADIVKANNANALNLTTSWLGAAIPGATDRALFTGAVTANRTTSLGADASWSGIVLSGNANTWTINGAFTLTLGTGGVDLSLASANFALAAPLQVVLGSPQTWSVTNGRQNTVSAPIAGAATSVLVKDGEGTLALNTNNTFTGGTVLNNGTLSVGNNEALGKGGLTVSNGVLRAQAAGYTVSNAIALAGSAAINSTAAFTLAGNISGAGSLSRASALAGTLILSGNNTYTGGTTNGSVIQLNFASALGTGPIVLLDGSTLKPGPGVFGTGNTGGITNTVILLGNATVTSVANTNIVFSGPITGGGGLAKTVNGDMVLSGNNTYSGGTLFSGGRLRLGHVNGLGTGDLTVNGGIFVANANLNTGKGVTNNIVLSADATFNTQTFSLTLSGAISGIGKIIRNNGPTGVLTLTGSNTFSGGLTNIFGALVLGHVNALGTGALDIYEGSLSAAVDLSEGKGVTNRIAINTTNGFGTVQIGGTNNLRLSGIISGTSGITKTGASTLTLAGENTYSGDTAVSNGVLAIDAGGSVSNSSSIYVAAGATLDVSASASGYAVQSGQTLTGSGAVTGSVTIASGARISGGTTKTVGTLTFQNDLTLNEGALIDWNVDSATGATDILRVYGTLTLPEHATIRISGASTLPKLRILFKASKIEGAAHVRNWTVLNGPQSMRAVQQDNQIVLLYTGLVVSLR